MKHYTVTKKTYKALAAEFATAFKDVKPEAVPKPVTLAEAMAPYRPHVLKQRQRGLTWKQIATAMSGPAINVKVSATSLRKLFGDDDPAQKAASAASVAAPSPAPFAPNPPTAA